MELECRRDSEELSMSATFSYCIVMELGTIRQLAKKGLLEDVRDCAWKQDIWVLVLTFWIEKALGSGVRNLATKDGSRREYSVVLKAVENFAVH